MKIAPVPVVLKSRITTFCLPWHCMRPDDHLSQVASGPCPSRITFPGMFRFPLRWNVPPARVTVPPVLPRALRALWIST